MTEPEQTVPANVPAETPITDPLTADALVASGAAPVIPNVEALMEQIQRLQQRVDSMSIAAGVPSDPKEAAMKDLRDHITARVNANPGKKDDFAEILDALKNLPDELTAKDSDYLRTVIDDFPGGYVEGLDYVKALATKLHKLVLKG